MKFNAKNWVKSAVCIAAIWAIPTTSVLADEPREKGASNEVREDGDKPKREGESFRGDRLRGDRPRGDGPRGDGPRGDGPRGDGPRGDGPRGDGPRGDGPRGDRPEGTSDARPGNPIMVVRMMMQRFDKDGDDKLDREELAAALTALREGGGPGAMFGGGPGAGGPMPERFFDQLDADKNGKLSGEEIPERLRQGMSRVDTNADGSIDKEELKSMAQRFGDRRPGGNGPRGEQGDEGNRRPTRPDAE